MTFTTRKELSEAIICEYNHAVNGQYEQLYNCKAWIVNPDNSDFLILKSYSTIVAAFQWSTGFLWVFDFYSRTTSSHISKFEKWIRYKYDTGRNWPKIVRLYNDSRTGKRAARKNIEDDFASVIASALNQR